MDPDDDLADVPPSVFARKAGPMPCWPLREAARIACAPGQEEEKVRIRFKNLLARGLVQTREDADSAQRLLGCDDVAVGLLLGELFDTGLANLDVAHAVSVACYAWNNPLNPRPAHFREYPTPIAAALSHGGHWALMVRTYVDDQNGIRQLQATLFDMDGPHPGTGTLPTSFLPRSTITIMVKPLLMPLTRFLRPARGN